MSPWKEAGIGIRLLLGRAGVPPLVDYEERTAEKVPETTETVASPGVTDAVGSRREAGCIQRDIASHRHARRGRCPDR